jgi:hypothetical protein
LKEIVAYAGRDFTHRGDIQWTVEHEKRFKFPHPVDLESSIIATDRCIWERRVDEYVKRNNKLTENRETAFSLVVGQCTEYMVAKLEGLIEYTDIKDNFDVIKLFNAVKGLTYQLDGHKNHTMALHLALKPFYMMHQGRKSTHAQYLKKIQTCVSIV